MTFQLHRSLERFQITRRKVFFGVGGGILTDPVSLDAKGLDRHSAVNVRDFGAKGIGDDTAALKDAHKEAIKSGRALFFPSGTYTLSGWRDESSSPFSWTSDEGATLIVNDRSIDVRSIALDLTPFVQINKTSSGLTFNSRMEKGIRNGDLICLAAEAVVETTRGEDAICETFHVTHVDEGGLEFDRNVEFLYSYAKNLKVTAYLRPRSATFRGLSLVTGAKNSHGRSVTFTGIANATTLVDCRISSLNTGDVSEGYDGVMVQESKNISIFRADISNCRYGLMISRGSYDVKIYDVLSTGNRHPLYFALWASKCAVRNLKGEKNFATVDCHSAFDVSYDGVSAIGDIDIGNLRSCGGSLVSAKIHPDDRVSGSNVFSISNQNWSAEYNQIWETRAVSLKDVCFDLGTRFPKDGIVFAAGEIGALRLSNVGVLPQRARAAVTITAGNIIIENSEVFVKEVTKGT